MNLLPGMLDAGGVQVAGATLPMAAGAAAPREVTLGVRPGDLRIAPQGIPARVEFVEDFGDSSIVNLEVEGQRVKVRAGELPGLQEGERVCLAFDPASAHLFDRASGLRL
jgi:ABC-type sugar transport system ATPase subunit